LIDELRELVYLIRDWLVSAEPGFWDGFWLGVVTLAIVAFLAFMVRIWWGEVTAPFRPQTVTHMTGSTPAQVTRRSCTAFVTGIINDFPASLCVI